MYLNFNKFKESGFAWNLEWDGDGGAHKKEKKTLLSA